MAERERVSLKPDPEQKRPRKTPDVGDPSKPPLKGPGLRDPFVLATIGAWLAMALSALFLFLLTR